MSQRILLCTSKTSWAGFNLAPSLGLYLIRQFVGRSGHVCDIFDFDLESESALLQKLAGGAYTVIGMSVSHTNMQEDLEFILKAKAAVRRLPYEVPFVIGGQAATLNAHDWLRSGLPDMVFLGFAHEVFQEYCDCLSNKTPHSEIFERLDGIAYIHNGLFTFKPAKKLTQHQFEQSFYTSVRSIRYPYPHYWDIVGKSRFDGFNNAQFTVETSRLYTSSHCPNMCGFCNSQQFLPTAQNARSPIHALDGKQLFELVTSHIEVYGTKAFLFSDDNFILGNSFGLQRLYDFCHRIIAAKEHGSIQADVAFFCQSRVAEFMIHNDDGKTFNSDLAELMYTAGFRNVGLGVETFSGRLLKSTFINKLNTTVEDCKVVIESLLAIGITPQIFIILGIPDATVDDVVETIELTADYCVRGVDVSVAMSGIKVFPGAPIYGRCGDFTVVGRTWVSPINNESIFISDYVEPKDEKIRYMTNNLEQLREETLGRIKTECGWSGSVIIPKTLSAMAVLWAAAVLLDKKQLADKLWKIIMTKMGAAVSMESFGRELEEQQ